MVGGLFIALCLVIAPDTGGYLSVSGLSVVSWIWTSLLVIVLAITVVSLIGGRNVLVAVRADGLASWVWPLALILLSFASVGFSFFAV